MSHHIILTISAAATLLTLSAAVQAQQDRRFTALAPAPYADQRYVVPNRGAPEPIRSHENFGSFSAASVAHTLGY